MLPGGDSELCFKGQKTFRQEKRALQVEGGVWHMRKAAGSSLVTEA